MDTATLIKTIESYKDKGKLNALSAQQNLVLRQELAIFLVNDLAIELLEWNSHDFAVNRLTMLLLHGDGGFIHEYSVEYLVDVVIKAINDSYLIANEDAGIQDKKENNLYRLSNVLSRNLT